MAYNSTIKPKIGICTECGDGKDKPLIGGKCQYHYWQVRRTPMPKASKPIRKVGKKLARRLPLYYRKKAIYMAEHEYCEVLGCGAKATDCHHKEGREGDLLTDETKFMAMCRLHHDMCKTHPEWAEENGYIISRLKVKHNGHVE